MEKNIFNRMGMRINMVINSLYYLKYRNPVVLNAWVEIRHGELIKKNWGDDINKYLIEKISGRKVLFMNMSQLHRMLPMTNYICIGSILSAYEDINSVIWGAGFISEKQRLRCKPKEIRLVRGKLTRDIILSQGIECPEAYGDPALLVSRYYNPKEITKKYKMGIITHFVDADNDNVKVFMAQHPDCIKIDLVGYKKWTDVLDLILSCEKTISSSLHGLIISDSYGIPNMWVKFSNKIAGGNFKYLDYFSSVGRDESDALNVSSVVNLEGLYVLDFGVNSVYIEFDKILNSCPFRK